MRPRWVASALSVVLLLAGGAGWWRYQARPADLPLLSAAVAVGTGGRPTGLAPGAGAPLLPGTRVLAGAAGADGLAGAQRAWLAAGRVPVVAGVDPGLVRDALLDLRVLSAGGPALAGWPSPWHYVWPRDASFVAVALSATGHGDDALRVLAWLQDQVPADGLLQARYRPDGTGPPDARGVQTDGTGFVLWAAARLVADAPDAVARAQVLARLGPLVTSQTAAAMRLTGGPGALPPASPDYWEVRDDRLSLGTAAPLAAGLEAAASLARARGDLATAAAAGARAGALRASLARVFGAAGWPRYAGDDAPDASLAFLLPPFTAVGQPPDPTVLSALGRAAGLMRRPAGGLAPGAGWKDDGISWTPETALVALAEASTGDRAGAAGRLRWLAAHRTAAGAVPEKVLHDGRPAGPAPLAWTDALVVLTAGALTR